MKVDVCIVGAGPGGALLAYLLAKKNISVMLIERTNKLAKAFRGEHLNKEGEDILKRHDLFNQIEQLGLLRMETLEYWFNGERHKIISPDPSIGHLGIHVPQAHLLQVIINEANQIPAFQFMLNTRVRSLLQDDEGQYKGVVAMSDGEEFVIESKLVIGADGRYSTVRKQAGLNVTIHKHGYDLLWARIPAPEDWSPSIKMALVDGQQLSLFTQTMGYIQIGWNIEQGAYSKLRKQPFTPFIEQLISTFPELEQTVSAYIKSWQDFVLLDVYSSKSNCWGKNGVALIGDAAHTMTPTGAFGLNSALKDAETIASMIDRQSVDQLDIDAYYEYRVKDIENIQTIQVEKEKAFSKQFVVLV